MTTIKRRPLGRESRSMLVVIHGCWKENGRGPRLNWLWDSLHIQRRRGFRKLTALARWGYVAWDDEPGSLRLTHVGVEAMRTGIHQWTQAEARAAVRRSHAADSGYGWLVANSGNSHEQEDDMATATLPQQLERAWLSAVKKQLRGATVETKKSHARVLYHGRPVAYFHQTKGSFRAHAKMTRAVADERRFVVTDDESLNAAITATVEAARAEQ